MNLRHACRNRGGLFRVATYFSVVASVVAALLARVAYGRVADAVLQMGQELQGLADVVGPPKTLFINGSAMNVATALTQESPKEVLDRFEALCREHPQFLVRAMADIPAEMKAKAEAAVPGMDWHRWLDLTTVRRELPDRGMLMCFTDDRPSGLRDLEARVQALKDSRDLGTLGHFHYVVVKRTPQGTHVRTIWTEGSLPVEKMFPATGDALGFDSPAVPRPPYARRVLSATSTEVPFSVHMYESPESEGEVRSFYDGEMAERGWSRRSGTGNTVVYEKPGADLVYCTFSVARGRTTVIATATGRPDTPVTTAIGFRP